MLHHGEARFTAVPAESGDDYWSQTREPLVSLLFLLPLLAVYEIGVIALGGGGEGLRNGVDVWLRTGLHHLGVAPAGILPVILVAGLLGWHFAGRFPHRVRLDALPGMLAESVLFAFVLIAGAQLGDVVFRSLSLPTASISEPSRTAAAITFVGAGIYEEVLFRLGLLPACYALCRLSRISVRWSAVLAVLTTSLTFSLAHHVGPFAEEFHLFPFVFRTAAGVFFAVLFLYRGFGITVGCHAAYDLLAGLVLR